VLRAALRIAAKDLKLTLGRGSGLRQALLLGFLLIFVFSLSLLPGQRMTAQAAAAIFWMASAFCQVLIFSTLYAHEENNGQRQGLLLAPVAVQSVWLGKALAGAVMLLAAQCLFIPATVVFLGQEITGLWHLGLAIVIIGDIGIVALGSLLGALSQGHSARESLLSIVLFPLLAPLFLGGIRIGAAVFSGKPAGAAGEWFGLALAFDAIFVAAALILFPAVYNAEE
jgi:heme exporter protein B